MYIRRKVFSLIEDENGEERYFSTTDYVLDNGAEDRYFAESEKESHKGLKAAGYTAGGAAAGVATAYGARAISHKIKDHFARVPMETVYPDSPLADRMEAEKIKENAEKARKWDELVSKPADAIDNGVNKVKEGAKQVAADTENFVETQKQNINRHRGDARKSANAFEQDAKETVEAIENAKKEATKTPKTSRKRKSVKVKMVERKGRQSAEQSVRKGARKVAEKVVKK